MKAKIKRTGTHFVYIVQCSKGTYYTGYTNDLEKRIRLHNKGDGAKYLRGRGPVTLVYTKEYEDYKSALRAERDIKRLTRKQKEELVRTFKIAEID